MDTLQDSKENGTNGFVSKSAVKKASSKKKVNETWAALAHVSNNVNSPSPRNYIAPPENIDVRRYDYVAVRIKGDCLSSRPESIKDGDTVAVRNLAKWFDFGSEDFLPNYTGRVIGLAVNGQILCKELVFVDFEFEVVTVKMFNPQQNMQFSFRSISKIFLIDAIISNAMVIHS